MLFRKILKITIELLFRLLKLMKFDFDGFTRFYFKFLLKEKMMNNRWIIKKPFIDEQNFYIDYIPDRYSMNYDKYLKENLDFFSYKDIEVWVKGNYNNNIGDLSRFFFLNYCFDILLKENISGNVAELGVYKGNSAFLLSKFARRINTNCYLFDTFESFDERDLNGTDAHVSQTVFKDTSLDFVKDIVGEENTFFIKGYFPESLTHVNEINHFALVHIDCDLEKPFNAALEYFYPKLKKGGFLIMHDYFSLCWPGAEKAIDNFFKDKPEFIIPIQDKSGTCLIRKI